VTLALLCLAALTAASQTPAPAPVPSFDIDRAQSYIIAITDKAGLFSFAGHKHGILAREWKATVAFDPQQLAGSRAEVRIPVASLVIDSPEALQLAGLKGGPKPEDVAKIQKQMLAAENLGAAQYPEIVFVTRTVAPQSQNFTLRGALTIRGKTNDIAAPVQVERMPDGAFRFTGEFTIKQSDYGIKPASVGGVVKVKDEVKVRFVVVARAMDEGKSKK
jgi:polyisoprenoid-binding protein YceI